MSRGFGAGYGKFGGSALPQQQHQQFDPSDLGGGAQGGDGFHGTQDAAQDTPGRGSQKRSGAIVQTLTPVTVCQLNNARNTHPDDIFKVDDRELNQITLVGQIVTLSVQSTNVELDLNDGTGKIGVRMWLDVEDELGAERKWDVGSYVRVIGNLRSFTGTKSVLAFRVLPIEKYDEVTYHFLDAINVHLAVTKDPEGTMSASSMSTVSSSSRGAASGSGTPARGGAGGARSGAVAPGRGFGRGQFSFAQNAVLDVIKAATKRSSDGCSVGEVYEALSSQITEDDIREAIEWLHAEGYLFNTIADDFFGCAE